MLFDHSARVKQIRHTLKHYFGIPERYWDLGETFMAWRARWQILQAADALDPERADQVENNSKAQTAVSEGYTRWFDRAQCAVIEAEQLGQVYQLDEADKQIYVGRSGVLAIVVLAAPRLSLVTSFRCVPRWTKQDREATDIARPWEDAAREWTARKILGIARRTAVRRADRRALGLQRSHVQKDVDHDTRES